MAAFAVASGEARHTLSVEADGAALHAAALSGIQIDELRAFGAEGPGKRLRGPRLAQAIEPATRIARGLIGDAARPVRAVMFDKTAAENWALAWHQDRTIAVKQRIEVDGLGPWTVKQGITHVAPPIDILARMVTLRLHLDDCGADNAPLRVALGSHRLGRVAASEAAAEAGRCAVHACLAEAGDIWATATPILHASERAHRPSRRRVLQIDFAAFDLPGGLKWLGLGDD